MTSTTSKRSKYLVYAMTVGAVFVSTSARGADDNERERPAVARETTIDSELAGLRRDWRSCFTRAQRRSPWLAGKLVVKVAFDRDGRIAEGALLSDTVHDRDAASCIRGTFRGPRRGTTDAVGDPVVVTMSVVAGTPRARTQLK